MNPHQEVHSLIWEFVTIEINCIALKSSFHGLFCWSDRPDPPTDIKMLNCASEYAEITWEPGNENNDEVIAFYVYYNTSFDEEGVFHEEAEVFRGAQSAKVWSRNAAYF